MLMRTPRQVLCAGVLSVATRQWLRGANACFRQVTARWRAVHGEIRGAMLPLR